MVLHVFLALLLTIWQASSATSILCALSHNAALHPIHVSMTNVEWNETTQKFEIIIKLYTDDFERMIEMESNTNISFANLKSLTEEQIEVINKYLNKNLQIQLNNHLVEFSAMQNWKTNGESVWFEYQVSYIRKIKKVLVQNKLMTGLYDDQTNLFIMTYSNKNLAHTFTSSNTFADLSQ